MDPRQIGPIAIVVDSSGRPVLNDDGEPIGVYRQEVSASQRKLNARTGKGRNIVWSSNTSLSEHKQDENELHGRDRNFGSGDDYPFSRSAVIERFHLQACIRKEIGPGFRLTEYGREMVSHCASRPSVVEPPDPSGYGGGNAKGRRRARRAAAAMAVAGAQGGLGAAGGAEEATLGQTPGYPYPVGPYAGDNTPDEVEAVQAQAEPQDVTWTDRELFERLSESPEERAARELRNERIERRLARDRELDRLIDPILERARERTETERAKRRERYLRKKKT